MKLYLFLEDIDSKFARLKKMFPNASGADLGFISIGADKFGIDIFKYKTIDDMKATILNKFTSSRKAMVKKGKVKVFENDKVKIYRLDSHEACASFSGVGQWCITGSDGEDWRYYAEEQGNTFFIALIKNVKGFMNKTTRDAIIEYMNQEDMDTMLDNAHAQGDKDEDYFEGVLDSIGTGWIFSCNNNGIEDLYDDGDRFYNPEFITYFLTTLGIPKQLLRGNK